MATKGDLVEAQRYSRRRLRTAFTSGIPQGNELEPRNYMRAIVGGVAISALMIVGSLLFGYIKPGLASGWENNKLLVGKSGTRYVSVSGTLYPVTNLASARLMIPAGEFEVKTVDENKLSSAPRGPLVGIVGAPDALPSAKNLIGSDWVSCLSGNDNDALAITLGDADGVERAASNQAILIQVGDAQYLVMNGYRYDLPATDEERTPVLRNLGLDSARPIRVPARWANLFTGGSLITEWGDLSNAGTPLRTNPDFAVGDLLTLQSGDTSRYYVVGQSEQLIEISEFARHLYAISATNRPQEREVTQQEIGSLGTEKDPAVPEDWPTTLPVALESPGQRCAVLTATPGGKTTPALATAVGGDETPEYEPYSMSSGDTVTIPPIGGALVRVRGEDPNSSEAYYFVDSLGTAYPIPYGRSEIDEILQRLGYEYPDLSQVPAGWVRLFAAGPALTTDGALTEVGTGKSVGGDAASPTAEATDGTDAGADTEEGDGGTGGEDQGDGGTDGQAGGAVAGVG